MRKIRLALAGAGMRGRTYTDYALAHPEQFEVVAVAEPVAHKREYIAARHHIAPEYCFEGYRELLEQPRLADAILICTMDDLHFEPAMKAIELGYDILLEKPAAPTAQQCAAIMDAAQEKGVRVIVCHVLRYTDFYAAVKRVIDQGLLGDILSVVHTEAVGHIHQSHSFVRGNWRRSDETAPMLLAKSCHDLDLIQWLIGKRCVQVQSFGALSYFTRAHMPQGAPERCIQGCPYAAECCYDAVKLYLKDENNHWFRNVAGNKVNPSNEEIEKALWDGPYGRCVYQCDNNVVDHQVVNMRFEGDTTVAFTMAAFNQGGRHTRIMGTKGELNADMRRDSIELFDFQTREIKQISTAGQEIDGSIRDGHGGGDSGIMQAFYEHLNGVYHGNALGEIVTSCTNHLIAFAAEESRMQNTVVDLDAYIDRVRAQR